MTGFNMPSIVQMILFRLNFTAVLLQYNTTSEYNTITINKMMVSSPPIPAMMI